MVNDPLTQVRTRNPRTPQNVRDNERQVQNLAGGYVYGVDDLTRLNRFLIMGSSGSYYANARKMTLDNAEVVMRMANTDPVRVVTEIVEISTQGRAAKQDPAIFALAIVAGLANDEGKAAAFAALPMVARTSSTFFTFSKYLTQFRSWSGRTAKRAGQAWYNDRPADRLAYQMLKYRARQGYSQRDMIRILHPKPPTPQHDALYRWAAKGEVGEHLPAQFRAFLEVQALVNDSPPAEAEKQAAQLIRDNFLPWEAVPDELMNSVPVWEALLDARMGMTALIRHLSRLTNLGMLGKGKGTRVNQVVEQLTDAESIRKARIHPMNVLIALKTYAQGHSVDGKGVWTPERKVIDALDEAFYTSFKVAEPTGKRILLAVDCSGSMSGGILGSPLNAREAAAAMALSIAKVEKDYDIVGFTAAGGRWSYREMNNGLTELDLSPRQRLDDAVRTINRQDFGATDCALPFTWALSKKAYYDTVIILTDAESWAGPIKVEQAQRDYRAQVNPEARLVVCAFTATSYTVGDPNDALTLNISGLDSAVPTLVQNFTKAAF